MCYIGTKDSDLPTHMTADYKVVVILRNQWRYISLYKLRYIFKLLTTRHQKTQA